MTKNLIVGLLLLSTNLLAQNPQKIYENEISEANLKTNLTYISSDSMGGRDTGSEGQKKVGRFIVDKFKSFGLAPIVKLPNNEMSYYQDFNLDKSGWKESYIIINGKKKGFYEDYYPIGLSTIPVETEIETVFVGYGIQSKTRNDYKNLDVKGKAVIFFADQPSNLLSDSSWAGSVGLKNKIKLANELGAKYAFEISMEQSDKFKTLSAERKSVLSRYNRMALQKPEINTSSTAAFVISKEMAAEILDIKPTKLYDYIYKNQTIALRKKHQLK